MTSIICFTETIWRNEFRCIYLKNEKLFHNFFIAFLKYILNFKHLNKKITLIADVFLEIPAPRNFLR